MVQLLLAVTLAGANTYTGVTTVLAGGSTVAGKAMTGGAQLYQPQNMLYFRTATTQWSSTDEVSLKMAEAMLAPVVAAQKVVLTDEKQLSADMDLVSTRKDEYKAALKKMQADLDAQELGKAEADAEAVEKAQKKYDGAVDTEHDDRVKTRKAIAKVATDGLTAIAQLSPMLDGLVSSGKAKRF